jgi:acyl-CoA synthetase (AMP-forming)/AMP-acid ligase II
MVGELWLRSPSVAGAYYGLPERSAETFGGTLPDGGGTYLRTGDLGFHLDGHTYLCGRAKDLILVGGRNVYPEDVEHCVHGSHPALRPGCTAAFAHAVADGEQVVVAAELRDPSLPTTELAAEVVPAIRAAVSRSHNVSCHSVLLLPPRSLPKTTSGKVQRGRCRDRWLAGRLPVLHEERAS